MGRARGFDQNTVLDRAVGLFADYGYKGTSIDGVVATTGLSRGSLYAIFGSKRGLFRATLHRAFDQRAHQAGDLVLVALLELAPRDLEIRGDCQQGYAVLFADDPALLGARLLLRAGISTGKELQCQQL